MHETILLVLHSGCSLERDLKRSVEESGFRVSGVFSSVEAAAEEGRADYALVDIAFCESPEDAQSLLRLARSCVLGFGCVLPQDAGAAAARSAAQSGATSFLIHPFESVHVACELGAVFAGNSLREQDAFFREAPVGIALLDSDGIALDVNEAFLHLFDFPSKSHVRGKLLRELIAGGTIGLQAIALEQLVLQGKRVCVDTKRKRSDGAEMDVSLIHAPATLPSGRTGIFCIYEDISERKKNENRLRRQLLREKLSSRISLSAMTSSFPEPVISEALQHLGLFAEADRARFVSLEAGPFGEPATWTRRTIPDVENDGIAHALRQENWMWSRLTTDRFLVIEDLRALWDRSSVAMERLRERRIGGLLAAPVVLRGVVLGAFVLECIDRKKSWDMEEIAFLRFLVEIFRGMAEQSITKATVSENRNRYHSIFQEFGFPLFLCTVSGDTQGGGGDVRFTEWNGRGGKYLATRGVSDMIGRSVKDIDPALAEVLRNVTQRGGARTLHLQPEPWGDGMFARIFSPRKNVVAFMVFDVSDATSM